MLLYLLHVLPVRPGMFVPESHHMSQLVHHDTKLVAVLSDRDCLGVLFLVNNVDPRGSGDIEYCST